MLYHLLYPLSEQYSALNVVRYVTFRTGAALATAIFLSLALGPWFIRTLRRLSVGQNIRDVGPESHQVKAGTPTMGGLLILFAVLTSTLLWAQLNNFYMWIVVGVTASFGLVGFYDDFIKVRKGRNLGLTSRQKFALQTVVASLAAVALMNLPEELGFEPTLNFPFFKEWVLNLGLLYIPFVALVLVGASNAVNMTDGLDGLAIGSTLIAAATYAIFSYVAGHKVVASYLQVPSVPGVSEVTVFCGALVGASLGFLWFNCHPAEVFMGDVGSLALGGAIGTVAVLVKQELVLVLVGGLFVAETVSVILQVGYFKMSGGKRIFRMAPLHHHFELVGWSEPKIIVRFWLVALFFAILGLATLKLR